MENQKSKTQIPSSLSEISHLFLSSIRDRQTQGVQRPTRKPPTSVPRPSVDLTPEEFAQVFTSESNAPVAKSPPVRWVISSHLAARQLDCVKRYARNLAASGSRVGLIFADVSEFQLLTFQPAEETAEKSEASETGVFDLRTMRDAISELSCDLDCWLIAIANPRVTDARAILRNIGRWVLLSTCDQDGVLAAYRAIKGLSDFGEARVSLALIDAKAPADADVVFRKLSSACQEFLNRTVEPEPAVSDASLADECLVMSCRTSHDKAQLAAANHWQVIAELIAQAKPSTEAMPPQKQKPQRVPPPANPVSPQPAPVEPSPTSSSEAPQFTIGSTMNVTPISFRETAEVIDLPAGDSSVLDAVMKHVMSEVVECPIRPPMCADARLAVTRERRMVLIAAASHGLADLKPIGLAYRWLVENRSLLAMALPQFALDAMQLPHLRLLVDQSDLNADVLQPIFQVETVSIHTYRRVRWGERAGLLLNAA